MALPYCIPYFDAHCDTLTKFNSLRQSSRNHIDLLRLHHYAPAAQVMRSGRRRALTAPRRSAASCSPLSVS